MTRGGNTKLLSKTELARRWGVSKSRVTELSKDPSFPTPAMSIDSGRRALYDPILCDRWRASRRPAGRPRKAA